MTRGTIDGRRRFLRRTFAGSAALLFGQILTSVRTSAQNGTPPAPLSFFDDHEFRIMTAVAGRIAGPNLPASLGARGAALRADAFLADADTEVQEQFHLLLTVFNSALAAFVLDGRFGPFVSMSPEAQDAYLRDWMTSPIAFRRTAFQALKRLSTSVVYTHPDSWPAIGFDGEYAPR